MLIILQGIDAAGKDGTIQKVMEAFNPQGCTVSAFKQPTSEELAHDFLWRIHKRVPGKGEIGIFNRSHYEDVLVVRVHKIVPRAVWSSRYGQIRDFEQMLTQTGTTVVKLFLYITKEEQRERFQERVDNPEKRWKFSMGDLEERKLWDHYIAAFEEALAKTSTDQAPWYVIPANRNWMRNLAVSTILADTIERAEAGLSAGARPAAQPRHRVAPAGDLAPARAIPARQHPQRAIGRPPELLGRISVADRMRHAPQDASARASLTDDVGSRLSAAAAAEDGAEHAD